MKDEQFYIEKPVPTGSTESDSLGTTHQVYITSDQRLLKWSGGFPLPDIGADIEVTMNSIGAAKVVGYFSSYEYLGVMMKPYNPPDWYTKQSQSFGQEAARPAWIREGIGCVFGNEFKLKA